MKALFKPLPISIFLLIALLCTYTNAAIFEIRNNCPYTVWPASAPIGGGRRLDSGQVWNITIPARTIGRIWPRTGCIFDQSGRGRCLTGDCNGVLQCSIFGVPPYTLAEYALNQLNNFDYFDISLVYGFNVPMDFRAISNGCTRGVTCNADINGQCPFQMRPPFGGGCNNPCFVLGPCGQASGFFKQRCPNAKSYPQDNQNTIYSCPGGTNYRVTFCP